MIYSQAAEDIAGRLSRDASRRLDEKEMTAGGAPLFSYYLNFNELDRYNRQGVTFIFDAGAKKFRYDAKAGKSWCIVIRAARKLSKRANGLSLAPPHTLAEFCGTKGPRYTVG